MILTTPPETPFPYRTAPPPGDISILSTLLIGIVSSPNPFLVGLNGFIATPSTRILTLFIAESPLPLISITAPFLELTIFIIGLSSRASITFL